MFVLPSRLQKALLDWNICLRTHSQRDAWNMRLSPPPPRAGRCCAKTEKCEASIYSTNLEGFATFRWDWRSPGSGSSSEGIRAGSPVCRGGEPIILLPYLGMPPRNHKGLVRGFPPGTLIGGELVNVVLLWTLRNVLWPRIWLLGGSFNW